MSISTLSSAPTPDVSNISGVAYRPPRLSSSEVFDPNKHLCFSEPAVRYSMEDLKLQADGVSPLAVVEPFPLFTPAAVRAFREDILSDRVLNEYTFVTERAPLQAREFNAQVARFTVTAWGSAEVTRCVSQAAGLELEPIMELELGHTNYYPPSISFLKTLPVEPSSPWPELSDQEKTRLEKENDITKSKQVVDWHFDSYPQSFNVPVQSPIQFVCVAMLSDASTMLGGETAVMCGDGSIRKIRQPKMGFATIIQGRHVKHLACKAYHAHERITMVTSYRAKDVLVRDNSWLSTIRPITKIDRLNYQWSLYRARLLAERFDRFAKQLEAKRAGLNPDDFPQVITKKEMQKFCEEQIQYLQTSFEEMPV